MIIASYKPNVRCNSLIGPPWTSCISIFADMYADKNRQTFGHLPDQRVEVPLPITYKAGIVLHLLVRRACSICLADRRCMVKLDIAGQPTGLSWYEVWEAVVALGATCVRGRQKGGKATGLGLYNCNRVQARVANAPRSRSQYIHSTIRRAPRCADPAVVSR